MLILTKLNVNWLSLDSSMASLISSEGSNGPAISPIWANMSIFKVSGKEKTYLSTLTQQLADIMLILTNLNDIWLSLGSFKESLPLQNSEMDPHLAQFGPERQISRYLGKKMPPYQHGIKTRVLMLILTNLNDICI